MTDGKINLSDMDLLSLVDYLRTPRMQKIMDALREIDRIPAKVLVIQSGQKAGLKIDAEGRETITKAIEALQRLGEPIAACEPR